MRFVPHPSCNSSMASLVGVFILLAALSGCGDAPEPRNSPETISVGGEHTCGLRESGQVVCWGGEWWESIPYRDDSYTAISSGSSHTCGLREQDQVVC